MSCVCESPVENPNPRDAGCVKCGLLLPPGSRDSRFERDFLDGAERKALSMGLGYRDLVVDRLTRAERSYGVNSYLDKGLSGLLREIDEEGLDLGGWGVLTALVADAEVVDPDARILFVTRLQEIAAKGAEVHQIVAELRRCL